MNFIELNHFAPAETRSQRGIRGAVRSGSRLLVRTLGVEISATISDSSYAAVSLLEPSTPFIRGR